MWAFAIDVVVGVHGDETEFAVPFQAPRLRVDNQVFYAIAPHAPVPAVQVPYPVTTLLNRRFRDALNSRTKAERIVIPVGLGTPRLATEVAVRKSSEPARGIRDSADGSEGQLSRESVVRQPFTSLKLRSE